ncbi:hypothetical protein BDV34DRAFT_220129 [Aspergillus parasiticus]|uniref:Zn(2)-C6 fungal-type domain-containing protein n=1 Tax=Aspergillus parasiticus TaxID=5067 RepID=A0A5N6E189_ASPPA|nr:hypothetical protein BDV34DRAFT_220129 [Aspergillus parasiticus]
MSTGIPDSQKAHLPQVPSSIQVTAPRRKKRRINYACNYCRARKTRCDERKPSCSACQNAGVDCITINLRRPELQVDRQEAGRNSRLDSPHALPGTNGCSTRSRGPNFHSATQAQEFPIGRTDLESPRGSEHQAETNSSSQSDPPENPSTLSIFRQDRGSTYCEILLGWIDRAVHRLDVSGAWPAYTYPPPSPVASYAFTGFGLCPLPSPKTTQHVVNLFLTGPNVLFPVLCKDSALRLVSIAQSVGPANLIQEAGYSSLLQVYLALLLGSLSATSPPEDFDPRVCLESCKTLMGHVLHESGPAAVQAMVLLAMAQRCYNNVTASCNSIRLAVSIANAIDLTRPKYGPPPSGRPESEPGQRSLWKTVCTFEQILAFELGRSSITEPIADGAGDRSTSLSSQHRYEAEAAKATQDLAMTLDAAGRNFIALSKRVDNDEGPDFSATIQDKLTTTCEAMVSLINWSNRVPVLSPPKSPTAELIQDPRCEPFEAFLSIHYHNAMLLLTRNSLVVCEEALQSSVDSISTSLPWESLMRSGPSIAGNAARKILRLTLHSAESQAPPILPCISAPLHAVLALTIHGIRCRMSHDVHVSDQDQCLLQAATDLIRKECTRIQGGAAVTSLLRNLERLRQGTAMLEAPKFGTINLPAPVTSLPLGIADGAREVDMSRHAEQNTSSYTATECWQDMDDFGAFWPSVLEWDWSGFLRT